MTSTTLKVNYRFDGYSGKTTLTTSYIAGGMTEPGGKSRGNKIKVDFRFEE